jgi:tetratricopeptide (TPR) repeat protein
MYADNFYYREYQQLLVDLHSLIAAGRNQASEAESLRLRMEQAESHLSEDEIVRLNALSADLAMIHEREIPDPDAVNRVLRQELPLRIAHAYHGRKWVEFLELLRCGVSHLWSADQIAYVRSRAYEGLGEVAPAVAFTDEAARRAPSNANYRALSLRLLWESKRYQEAYSRACGYLADPATKPRLILMSGAIVAQQSMLPPEPADLKSVAIMAIDRMRQALPLENSPNLVFAGWVALGLLAVQVDDTHAAVSAFRQAVELETAFDEQVTWSWAINKELEILNSGKAKTPEERSNARHLAEISQPSAFAVAA